MTIKIPVLVLFLGCTALAYGQESLKIVWIERYEWQLLSNQENGETHLMELIPGNESADNWTILGQMMSIKGARNVPMEKAQRLMFDQTKTKSPYAELTPLEMNEEDEYPWILFTIESFKGDHAPESQLWYIRQGKTSLYVNFVALKAKTLNKHFIAEWSNVFKTSEIVELSDDSEKEEKPEDL